MAKIIDAATRPRINLPDYIQHWVNDHGQPQFRLRKKGLTFDGKKTLALPGLPWSPDFMAAYYSALGGKPLPPPPVAADRTKSGTLNDAIIRFYEHPNFQNLGRAHQMRHRQKLERFRQEPEDAPRGALPLRSLNRETLQAFISKIEKQSAQRHLMNALRALMDFAMLIGFIEVNPCEGLKGKKRAQTGGFKTGKVDDIEKYQAHFPLGTMARLALEIMLCTGVRRSDAYLFGRQHVNGNGLISIKTTKTGATVNIPMDGDLRAAIDAMPPCAADVAPLAYLLTSHGTPFKSAAGFGNWFGDQCRAAGVEFRAHGLRKACAVRLANLGVDALDIAAVLGHKDLREVMIYVAEYKRAEATARAMAALAEDKRKRGAR